MSGPDAGDRADARAWDADDAVEQLYAAHYRQLVRLSVLLVRDPETAEEVVQDAFVAMHGRWRSLREPDKALAYLRQAVVNRSRSVLRRRVVAARHVPEPVAPRPGADEDTVVAERRTHVLEALRALPQRQREVVALRYYLDLSEAQIADALGISNGAVKSHASRAAAALRTSLGPLLDSTHETEDPS
jgi:RNA polymerase sigma-70 factor (sigma-E family)